MSTTRTKLMSWSSSIREKSKNVHRQRYFPNNSRTKPFKEHRSNSIIPLLYEPDHEETEIGNGMRLVEARRTSKHRTNETKHTAKI